MLNLFYSHNMEVESAYIITVVGNQDSENYAKRCADSCQSAGMRYKFWEAYNGLKSDKIVPPNHLANNEFMNMLKITDHYLTRGEVACALSHISLWNHCVLIDRPIVILEHDAIVIKDFPYHVNYNSIVYLGGQEWKDGWSMLPIPPHGTDGPNLHFICRAHAYSIDPTVAKNMLAHVLHQGINAPLDIMLRTDLFSVTHCGFYAYDMNLDSTNDTTIKNRPIEGRTTKRNPKLEW